MKKYTAQPRKILHETPETYNTVVEPYIESFPPERLEWVRAILEGRKEAERVVYRSPELPLVSAAGGAETKNDAKAEGESGSVEQDGDAGIENTFVLVPDLKWDGTTARQLYLTAIAGDGRIRSLRDLRAEHLPLLRAIQQQAYASAKDKYGVGHGDLRMFIHYQPSYCECREAKMPQAKYLRPSGSSRTASEVAPSTQQPRRRSILLYLGGCGVFAA